MKPDNLLSGFEVLCPKCGGDPGPNSYCGDHYCSDRHVAGCDECHGVGTVLTEIGKQFKAFNKRHIKGRI